MELGAAMIWIAALLGFAVGVCVVAWIGRE
jgi:hypothetical protein